MLPRRRRFASFARHVVCTATVARGRLLVEPLAAPRRARDVREHRVIAAVAAQDVPELLIERAWNRHDVAVPIRGGAALAPFYLRHAHPAMSGHVGVDVSEI